MDISISAVGLCLWAFLLGVAQGEVEPRRAEGSPRSLAADVEDSAGQTMAGDALRGVSPHELPKVVRLKEPSAFPAIVGGKVIGSVQLPVGTSLKLLSIQDGKAVVEYNGTTQRLEAKSTDILESILATRSPAVPVVKAAAGNSPAVQVSPEPVPLVGEEKAGAGEQSPSRDEMAVHEAVVSPSPPPSGEGASNNAVAAQRLVDRPKPDQIQMALQRSGENRPELEKALKGAGKEWIREMEILISSARQYDLVNLTAEHLLHTIEFCSKAREEMPWGRSIPEAIWLEYVLPYRVADEDLDDWRPEFYETLAPLAKEAGDTQTAARAIHQWLYRGGNGNERIEFRVTDSRDQTPRQMLNQTKIARCFELNLALVALLRSVGIPARHAGVAYWTATETYHYWVEYWDSKSNKWLALEPVADPDQLPVKNGMFAVAYAFPGFSGVPDPIGRERWDLMTNVSKEYAPAVGRLEVGAGALARNGATFAVYAWNSSAWRMVASVQGKERAAFELAVNDLRYPYLVSASVNGRITWQFVRISAGKTEILNLNLNARLEELMVEYKTKTPTKK